MSYDDDPFGYTPIGKSVHALLGPSSSERWSSCTASPQEQVGKPDNAKGYTRFGTAAHLLAETAQNENRDPAEYLGRKVAFWIHPESSSQGSSWAEDFEEGDGVINDPGLEFVHIEEITDEHVDCAGTYVSFVDDLVKATGGVKYVEQRVPIGWITGEEDAEGTADNLIDCRHKRHLIVVDLKGGMMKVDAFYMERVIRIADLFGNDNVEPLYEKKANKQLAMYGAGALQKLGWEHYDTVELHIVQPRLNHFSSHTMTVAELRELCDWLSKRAEETRTNPRYEPSYDNCFFCKAKDTCKARQRQVLTDATAGFEDHGHGVAPPRAVEDFELGVVYEALDQIEDWCSNIRERVRNELLAGKPVIGRKGRYRLAEGRNTARKWTDPEEAKQWLVGPLGLLPYAFSEPELRSPAQIEELTKKRRGNKARSILAKEDWARIQHLITQDKGRPSVVLEIDDRPPPSDIVDFDDAEPRSGAQPDFDPFK